MSLSAHITLAARFEVLVRTRPMVTELSVSELEAATMVVALLVRILSPLPLSIEVIEVFFCFPDHELYISQRTLSLLSLLFLPSLSLCSPPSSSCHQVRFEAPTSLLCKEPPFETR